MKDYISRMQTLKQTTQYSILFYFLVQHLYEEFQYYKVTYIVKPNSDKYHKSAGIAMIMLFIAFYLHNQMCNCQIAKSPAS